MRILAVCGSQGLKAACDPGFETILFPKIYREQVSVYAEKAYSKPAADSYGIVVLDAHSENFFCQWWVSLVGVLNILPKPPPCKNLKT